MARAQVARRLATYGGRPVWRETCVTDSGNHILDVHDLVINDPPALERELNQIAGVVTVGLFAIRPADVLLLGRPPERKSSRSVSRVAVTRRYASGGACAVG